MSSFKVLDDDVKNTTGKARFTVFGVGGGGGNAVEHMIVSGIQGVTFVCANTDMQDLHRMSAKIKIQLGSSTTKGLGAGQNPDTGKQAALENKETIQEVLKDAEMVFITAGMGGGTGTGAAPVIAEIARSMGVLTVGVVTTPFNFEGEKLMRVAEQGIAELEKHVDSLIVIPNQNLLKVFRKTPMVDAFKCADNILLTAVTSIFELVIKPGYINLDFADLTRAMQGRGYSMMGIGEASGEGRARAAVEEAIASPLLDNVRMENAKGVVINITGSTDVLPEEVEEIAEVIGQIADLGDGDIFYGMFFDPELQDKIRVTVVATGLQREYNNKAVSPVKSKLATAPVQIPLEVNPSLDLQDDEDTPAINRRPPVDTSAKVEVSAEVEAPKPTTEAEAVKKRPSWSAMDFLKNQKS